MSQARTLKSSFRLAMKPMCFVFCPANDKQTTKCKENGINFYYEILKVMNFTVLRQVIHEDNTLHVQKYDGAVVSEQKKE